MEIAIGGIYEQRVRVMFLAEVGGPLMAPPELPQRQHLLKVVSELAPPPKIPPAMALS